MGLTNLLTFHGTDTFSAAYLAMKMGAERPTGTSILALAHRIVQGHKNELDSFEQIGRASDQAGNIAIASYVADCYNFRRAVEDHLVKLASKYPARTYVARPDSGDPVDNILFILRAAKQNNLNNLRFIEGDSVNPRKQFEIWESLRDNGYSPTRLGIFGVGGYRINTPNRDSLSAAYKLSAKGQNKPVMKLSEVPGKMSVPGPNFLCRMENSDGNYHDYPTVFLQSEEGAYQTFKNVNNYVTYYDADQEIPFTQECVRPFVEIQGQNFRDFDRWVKMPTQILSDEILNLQRTTSESHKTDQT